MSVLKLVPHCVYHCSFVVSFEIGKYESSNLFFLKILLAAWDSLELSYQLFHLYKKGYWARVFIDSVIYCIHWPLGSWKPSSGHTLRSCRWWSPSVNSQCSLWMTAWTDRVAFFRSGIWVLPKTVSRAHSMVWSKPYFQTHYALSIYFKIFTNIIMKGGIDGGLGDCLIWVFIFEVRKLNSKILGSK